MGTAEQVLEAHGFGGARLLKLARKIANDELRRRGGFLDNERMEDLVAFLALKGVQAAVRYDPDRFQGAYGRDGGDPFASWIADILSHRVTDWYRSKAEGHGDRRYGNDGKIVLDGDMRLVERADAFDHELELRRIEQGVDLDEAEAELGRGLSEEAREGLRLVRLRVAGSTISHERVRTKGGVRLTKTGRSIEAARVELSPLVLKPRPRRPKRPPIRATVASVAQIRPLLALPDVSARLNYSEKTVRRLIARGDLPAVQPGGAGGRIRVDPDELERWLSTQRVPTRGAA